MWGPIVPFYQMRRPLDWEGLFGRKAALDVEIGFGLGEFLIRSAQENPRRNYVGIEEHWERICKTLRRISKTPPPSGGARPIQNIRILRVDARLALERFFLEQSIDRVYCLFPCPWPKKGHLRHRLFSHAFLEVLNSRLKSGGQVKIVTDSHPYFDWILQQIDGTGFQVVHEKIGPRYDTKFERKWLEKGQKEFFALNLVKTKPIRAPWKKDTPLKAYQIKSFTPEKFRFQDQKGDISVIFKELLFDARIAKAMVHVVVSEENLTQHFWVTILQKQKTWQVYKADGQNILPTPGIARAIELVYEAADAS